MTYKRTGYRQSRENKVDYWPSMVDIMSSSALILFFAMALFAVIASYNSLRYRVLTEELEREKQIQEDESTRLEERHRQLVDDIERIIDARENMYDTLMTELNKQLGPGTVMRDETRLYVDAETLFEFNEWKLTMDGRELAKELGKAFMKIVKEQQRQIENSENSVRILNIEVIGHTDNRGAESRNRLLSAQRSGVFVDYMLSELSEEDLLKYGSFYKSSSMSKYSPIAGTVISQTDEERARNRRIEFIINFSDEDFNYLLEKYSEGG
jgi:outer membrane protein OmpA-like peptidoglycan-associated protein